MSLIATATQQVAVGIVAAEESTVLLRAFLVALIIVAPLALWQWRRISDRRGRQRSASYQEASDLSSIAKSRDRGATLEAVVAEINRVGSTLQSSEESTIEVPSNLTVGGRSADPQLVEAVLRDALERSGLEIAGTTSDDGGVLLQCRRR